MNQQAISVELRPNSNESGYQRDLFGYEFPGINASLDCPKVGLKDPQELRSWVNELRWLSDNTEEPSSLSHSAAGGGGMGERG